MTPERWARVTEIFHAALELPPAERDAFVEIECKGDEDLRREVKRLLDDDDRAKAEEFLDTPQWEPPTDETGSLPKRTFITGQLVSGRYRIIRFIAKGGMGEVYEAFDQELKTHDALKTVLPEIAADDLMIRRFKLEISNARRVTHPNVCRIHDLNYHGSGDSKITYLTMEYLQGRTLSEKLKDGGPMSTQEALPLVRQMADALDAAHRAGVIHRDFKASNVMLIEMPAATRAVVTDFGLAHNILQGQEEQSITGTGNIVGTWDYMAPELLEGAPATVASDIYALGMVIYRMVTGTRPFADSSGMAAAVKRAKEPAPSPRRVVRDLDARWEAAILRCLEQRPERRFSRATDLPSALSDTAPVSGQDSFKHRRRTALYGAIAAAVLILASVVFWMLSGRPYQPSGAAQDWYQKGNDYLQAGTYFAATKALEQAIKIDRRYSLAHARLAEALTELTVYGRAKDELIEAQSLAAESPRPSNVDQQHIEAVRLIILRDFPRAAEKYRGLLNKVSDARRWELYLDLGRAYERANRRADAIHAYELASAGPVKNPAASLRLATLYTATGDHQKAARYSQEAESQYRALSNDEGLTEVLFQRGAAANRNSDLATASALLHQVIERAKLTGDPYHSVKARLQLSTWALQSSELSHAKKYAEEAIEEARANGIESVFTDGIRILGNFFLAKGDFPEAEKYLQQALIQARTNKSPRQEAGIMILLADLHARQMQLPQALDESTQALRFFEQNNMLREAGIALGVIGRVQRDAGNFAAAMTTAERQLALAEKIGSQAAKGDAHETMGNLLLTHGRYAEALNHFEKSLPPESSKDIRLGMRQLQCANALWRLGRSSEAETFLSLAAASSSANRDLAARVQALSIEMLTSRGNYAAVVAECHRALASPDLLSLSSGAEIQTYLGYAEVMSHQRKEGFSDLQSALRQR